MRKCVINILLRSHLQNSLISGKLRFKTNCGNSNTDLNFDSLEKCKVSKLMWQVAALQYSKRFSGVITKFFLKFKDCKKREKISQDIRHFCNVTKNFPRFQYLSS